MMTFFRQKLYYGTFIGIPVVLNIIVWLFGHWSQY